jgi:hypothetical protein
LQRYRDPTQGAIAMSKRNNQKGASDNTGSAPESGDALMSGRNRGQVVEPGGSRQDQDVPDESDDQTGDEFESGRQDAAPRSGA